jgi:hypothetical protein
MESQKTATFMFENKQSISIPFQGNEKLVELIKKYIKQINPNSNIVDYNFYYEGKKIERSNYENPIKDNDFGKNGSFILSVEKNIKIIKCPVCNYDDCVVSLRDYKTTFYNCEHKHLHIGRYETFLNDQIYHPENIICSEMFGKNCKKNGGNDPDMQLCLTCSKIVDRTRSICSDCIKQHKEQNHEVIKYEDKNYYCQKHIKKIKKYCFECKQSFCESCVKKHDKKNENNGHHIKSIDLLIPLKEEINKLKDSLKKISEYMDTLKVIINGLNYSLNRAMDLYKDYYKCASHIIEKYETFNKGQEAFKNFTIFKCLYNLKLSNRQILDDIKSIINKKTNLEKAKDLIEIYTNKKKEYDASDKSGGDLNKEDDRDWFKEVCERERKIKEEREKDINPTYHLQI